jgi:hypothetical protein
MTTEENTEKPETTPDKPDPIEDVRKGLGLLFRAAKSTLEQLPTRQVEQAVVSGAREVGRAFEAVTGAIDKQLFKRDAGSKGAEGDAVDAGPDGKAEANTQPESTPGDASEPKGEARGPRVG